jgi:hypothetical protein
MNFENEMVGLLEVGVKTNGYMTHDRMMIHARAACPSCLPTLLAIMLFVIVIIIVA